MILRCLLFLLLFPAAAFSEISEPSSSEQHVMRLVEEAFPRVLPFKELEAKLQEQFGPEYRLAQDVNAINERFVEELMQNPPIVHFLGEKGEAERLRWNKTVTLRLTLQDAENIRFGGVSVPVGAEAVKLIEFLKSFRRQFATYASIAEHMGWDPDEAPRLARALAGKVNRRISREFGERILGTVRTHGLSIWRQPEPGWSADRLHVYDQEPSLRDSVHFDYSERRTLDLFGLEELDPRSALVVTRHTLYKLDMYEHEVMGRITSVNFAMQRAGLPALVSILEIEKTDGEFQQWRWESMGFRRSEPRAGWWSRVKRSCARLLSLS